MPFTDVIKEESLVRSRRSCCICNDFVGRYTNVHHIIPEAQGGPSTIDNAIVLCLRCHGEVGHYNPKHPIGNKYTPNELIRLRDEWWKWCSENPGRPLPKHPISISPSQIILSTDNRWQTKTIFSVYNTKQQFYYEVWVKIVIDSPDIQCNDISIEILKGGTSLKLSAGNIEMDAVALQLIGTDQAGNKSIFISIRSISPHELYSFQIEQKPTLKISPSSTHKINIGISGFSDNSPSTFEGSSQASIGFTPPERMTITSTRVLLRRKN